MIKPKREHEKASKKPAENPSMCDHPSLLSVSLHPSLLSIPLFIPLFSQSLFIPLFSLCLFIPLFSLSLHPSLLFIPLFSPSFSSSLSLLSMYVHPSLLSIPLSVSLHPSLHPSLFSPCLFIPLSSSSLSLLSVSSSLSPLHPSLLSILLFIPLSTLHVCSSLSSLHPSLRVSPSLSSSLSLLSVSLHPSPLSVSLHPSLLSIPLSVSLHPSLLSVSLHPSLLSERGSPAGHLVCGLGWMKGSPGRDSGRLIVCLTDAVCVNDEVEKSRGHGEQRFTLLPAVCSCFLLLFQCFSAGTAGGSMDNWITGLWDNRAPSSPRARASIERALPLLSRVCVCVSLWPCPHPSSIIPAQPSNSSKGERRDTENTPPGEYRGRVKIAFVCQCLGPAALKNRQALVNYPLTSSWWHPSLSRPVAFGLVGDGPSDRAVSSFNTPPLVWVREAKALTGQAQSRASGSPAEQNDSSPAGPGNH
ncbi:unnamed protein product [Leuciscus chuanchicus]